MKSFKNWLISEGKDLFGFENLSVVRSKQETDNDPIKNIDSGLVIEHLIKRELGYNNAFSNFHDHIQWGKENGAVQMVISPLGSFKSIIRKLQTDLKGNSVWMCKKILPYKEITNSENYIDEEIADEIFNKIEECWKEEIEAPLNDYENLERLTIKVAETCRKKDIKPEIMVYRGVKAIEREKHYNIHFECSGHGVEAPGSMRLEQFSIDMFYDKQSGMIRSYGYGIQSPTRQHLWQIQPSEWDEIFSPSQSEKEIVSAVAAAFSTF